MKKIALLLIALYIAQSCKVQVPAGEAPIFSDLEVQRVMNRAFDAAGGWERWKDLETISYKKRSVLYHADGSVESDITQFHEYQLHPEFSGSIFWKDAEGSHSIVYKNNSAEQFLNGQIVKGKNDTAKKSFLSASYVLLMPFKIADEGVTVTHEGVETLDKGETVDVIKAVYAPTEHSNHSTDDIWYFYFEQSTGNYLGSMVYHAPTYAYIRNTSVNRELPLAMNTYRESYRSDGDRNIEFLRGEFFYNDYLMTFIGE